VPEQIVDLSMVTNNTLLQYSIGAIMTIGKTLLVPPAFQKAGAQLLPLPRAPTNVRETSSADVSGGARLHSDLRPPLCDRPFLSTAVPRRHGF
jgi:hypothetical protein